MYLLYIQLRILYYIHCYNTMKYSQISHPLNNRYYSHSCNLRYYRKYFQNYLQRSFRLRILHYKHFCKPHYSQTHLRLLHRLYKHFYILHCFQIHPRLLRQLHNHSYMLRFQMIYQQKLHHLQNQSCNLLNFYQLHPDPDL